MKKTLIASLIVMMFAGLALALEGDDGHKLSGAHETLNIIGVSNPKKTNMDAVESDHGVGSVIFVNLDGPSKICLVEGDEFAVLDKNGTDADGATFQMMDPDLDPYIIGDEDGADTTSAYSIYVRPLGKPEGWAKITTCADVLLEELGEFLGNDEIEVLNDAGLFGGVCSVESVPVEVTTRHKGKSTFANVTAELTTIVLEVSVWVDANGDDIVDPGEVEIIYVRVPIFDDILENEYWQYENHGLKLLQVRIYPWGTDVSLNDI
jgi:hypothetical protein